MLCDGSRKATIPLCPSFSLVSRPNLSCPCYCRISGQIFSCSLSHTSPETTVHLVAAPAAALYVFSTKYFAQAYRRRRRLLASSIFFFKTGSTTEPSSGPAKDPSMAPTGKKILFCVRLLHFPPIYQTPLLNDSFLILKSHRLVARCYVIVT